jgi:crossover junction endodeoxyribonuclease RuvC
VIDYTGNRFRVIEYGVMTTPAHTPFSERLESIFDQVTLLLEKHRPDAISMEELFFNTNITTGIQVAHARGVLVLGAKKKNIPIYEYTPLQVKQAITGYGRAEKRQVMEMTKMFLNLDKIPRPDDAADALALAICHAHSSGSSLYSEDRI